MPETAAHELPPLTLQEVHLAPGHLIRRAQQISTAIFQEEFEGLDITQAHYAAMVAIRDRPGMDQVTLVNSVAIDRSSIGTALARLEQRGLIRRVVPESNGRIRQLFITPAGVKLLDSTRQQIQRVYERILAPLSKDEQATFIALLSKMVDLNNDLSRAPLRLKEPQEGSAD